MGTCYSPKSAPNVADLTPAEQKAHQGIQDGLIHAASSDKKAKKLLLLGAGSSGKSTLFKQLKCIHGWGFENSEFLESRHNIRQNIVMCAIKLLQESERLYDKKIITAAVNLADKQILGAIQCIASFKDESFEFDLELNWNAMENLGNALHQIWNLDAMHLTYNERGRFAIPDNMDYFFDKVRLIFKEEYYPSHHDVLRTRIRTTGMIETKYELNDAFFHIYDVGGQRNERRKWIHSFENVTAVIFVAALNHYNRVLFEDEKKNAMHESIALFDEVINSKWFKKTEIILFLNKKDLFIEALRDGYSLSICFNANNGWEGLQWIAENNRNEYIPSDDRDEETDHSFFDECYEAAVRFITNVYLSYNNKTSKRIFVHVTDATDRDQIEKVFWDVQDIVIRSNLKRGGFV